MSKFHINGEGEPGRCRAMVQCPFGGEDEHFSTAEDARKAYELTQKHLELAETAKRKQAQDDAAYMAAHGLTRSFYEVLFLESRGHSRSVRPRLSDSFYVNVPQSEANPLGLDQDAVRKVYGSYYTSMKTATRELAKNNNAGSVNHLKGVVEKITKDTDSRSAPRAYAALRMVASLRASYAGTPYSPDPLSPEKEELLTHWRDNLDKNRHYPGSDAHKLNELSTQELEEVKTLLAKDSNSWTDDEVERLDRLTHPQLKAWPGLVQRGGQDKGERPQNQRWRGWGEERGSKAIAERIREAADLSIKLKELERREVELFQAVRAAK